MMNNLHLKNFKCFADQHLRIAPLTLLSGLNGMGKSSVIQSLLVLRQSYQEGVLQRGTLLTAGNLVDLGTASDVLFERAKEDSLEIALTFSDLNVLSFKKPKNRTAAFGFAVASRFDC